ncbi:DDE-type integrase/transposase/recombinase, partial [Modestobacter lapidis]|nr:DDE-type integrase/transposase/recombinase [Modestobacter lapidis]
EKGLSTISTKKLVEGVPECSMGFGFCEHCLYGKQNRVKFKGEGDRATAILDLVHSDVCESPEESLGGSRYFVSFIDDYSRHAWIYFLKRKSEVINKFREFKALVENQFDRRIKVLRTDNGKEYEPVDKFCAEVGIARQNTIRYTPQQNGVAERLNRTLMDKARCMLSWAGLKSEFWAEAVATACYLKNRTPTSAVVDQTPFEVLHGRKPRMAHVRVFGCDAYMHVPKEKRTKLDLKSEKCKFVGYKDGVKGYKLWNPETQKIVYSRDVVFRETPTAVTVDEALTEKPEITELEVCPTVMVEDSDPLD